MWVVQGKYVKGQRKEWGLDSEERETSSWGVGGANERRFNSVYSDHGVEDELQGNEDKGRNRLLGYSSREDWSGRSIAVCRGSIGFVVFTSFWKCSKTHKIGNSVMNLVQPTPISDRYQQMFCIYYR